MPFTPFVAPLLSAEQASPYANLIQNAMQNYMTGIQAKYLPLTSLANAASKLTYSSLMGPQFIAKLMSDPRFMSNLTEGQRQALVNMQYGAGTGTSLSNPFIGPLLGGQTTPAPTPQQLPQKSTLTEIGGYPTTAQVRQILRNQKPGDAYTLPTQPGHPGKITKYEEPFVSSETTQETTNEPIISSTKDDYFTQSGKQLGKEEQEKALGKVRADAIADFGNQIEAGQIIGDKFNTLTNLINNPEFRNMLKDIPFFQDKQLKILSKTGTPYQQELIGNYINTANEIVGDIIQSFGRQKFKGESDIANSMKINENDTFNVMVGKVQSAFLYKNLKMERARIASELMKAPNYFSKDKALQIADKQIDADKIRADINSKMDYEVPIRRMKKDGTYETMRVKKSVARRMGADV